MRKLFQSFFILGLFLTLILVAPSKALSQDTYTISFDKNSIEQLGLSNINWIQYNGLAEEDGSGGVVVTFSDPKDYVAWQEFGKTGKIPAPSNDGTLQMPNQEIGGISNAKGGSDTASKKNPSIDTPPLAAPSITGDISSPQDSLNNVLNKTFNQGIVENDFDNMVAAEMAGLDVEIAKINDELYGGNATGNGTSGGLQGVCANAGNIFKQIACKVMMFLVDLRVLAYIISGFGMVMFAWAAIFNKISWKHFSQIAIGLFMLSMIGPFITYFTGYTDIEKNLEYGNYLGGNYNPIQGSTDQIQCADGSTTCTPDTNTKTVNSKWTLKDLKGSIQSGLNLVRSGYNAYQTAKNTYNNVKAEAQNIGNAIKNSGGGLDGVLNAASQVAGAANRLSFDVKTGVGGIAAQASNAANAAQDITATNDQREERQNIRVNGSAGNNTTNAVSEWLSASGTGGQAIGKVGQVTDTVGKAAAGVGKATTAGHEGQKIGGNGGFGDVVGGIFAAGTAVGEGIGVYDQVQKENAVRQQQQQPAAQAKAQASSQVPQSAPQMQAQSQQASTATKSAGQTIPGQAAAIMNNAASAQTAKVNNSVGFIAQQNQVNATVDSQVNAQISSGNNAVSSSSSVNQSANSAAVQAVNEQLKQQEQSAASSQSSSSNSGYDVSIQSAGTTFKKDENGNMVAYDVQEQVFTNPATGSSATVRGDGVIIYKTNPAGSGSVGGSTEYRIGADGRAAVYYDGVYSGTYEADDSSLKIIMSNGLIQQAKSVNPEDLMKKQGG